MALCMKKSLADLVQEAHSYVRAGEYGREEMTVHISRRLMTTQNLRVMVTGNLVSLVIFVMILWAHHPFSRLAALIAAVVVTTFFAARTIHRAYRSERDTPGESVSWERRYVLSNIALGLSWGSVVFLTIPYGLMLEQAVIVTGLIALVTCTLITHFVAGLATGKPQWALALATLVPHAVLSIGTGQLAMILMGVGLLFMVALFYVFHRMSLSTQEHYINLWFDYLEAIDNLETEVEEKERTARELEISNQKATEANRRKTKFISLVSHDLRSPLTLTSIFLAHFPKILAAKGRMEVDKLAQIELRRLNETVAMIDNLLDITALEEGEYEPEMAAIEIRPLCDEIALLFEGEASKKGITFSNQAREGAKAVANPPLLRQVVANLVSNAVKFSNKGDVITFLSSRSEEGQSRIIVSDQGGGIDHETMDNLFRYDVRTSEQGTAGEKGKGLGLPLCHDIMNAMGGSLTAVSTPGVGSVFTVETPSSEEGLPRKEE